MLMVVTPSRYMDNPVTLECPLMELAGAHLPGGKTRTLSDLAGALALFGN